jgi:type VI secretion system protein ImpM
VTSDPTAPVPAAGTELPGWFGKLPCLGDFASRRLDRAFIAAWDDWLARVMLASREALGDRWRETYLYSPLWCFLLGNGVLGGGLWAGVLMPSVDRVGRHFPLTLAAPLRSLPGDAGALQIMLRWLDVLAEAALATLNEMRPVDALEQDLAALAAPSALLRNREPARWSQWFGRYIAAERRAGTDSPESSEGLYGALLDGALEGRSLWWTAAASGQQALPLLAEGLPDAGRYTAMLTGQTA